MWIVEFVVDVSLCCIVCNFNFAKYKFSLYFNEKTKKIQLDHLNEESSDESNDESNDEYDEQMSF